MALDHVVKLNLRLPKSLHRQLQKDAAKNGVSLNTEILGRLGGARASLVRELAAAVRPDLQEIVREAIRRHGFELEKPATRGPVAEPDREPARSHGEESGSASVASFDSAYQSSDNPSRPYENPRKHRDKSA